MWHYEWEVSERLREAKQELHYQSHLLVLGYDFLQKRCRNRTFKDKRGKDWTNYTRTEQNVLLCMARPPCYPAYWQTLGGKGGGGGLVDCLYWKYKRCGLWASTTLTWWPWRGLLALAAKGSVVCRVQSVTDKAIPYPPPHHCKNNKKQKKTNRGNKPIQLATKTKQW